MATSGLAGHYQLRLMLRLHAQGRKVRMMSMQDNKTHEHGCGQCNSVQPAVG